MAALVLTVSNFLGCSGNTPHEPVALPNPKGTIEDIVTKYKLKD